jgi:chromosome segregation ATPase
MDSNDFLNRKREYENEINQLKENNKELKNTINEYVKIMEDDSNQINQLKKEINELKDKNILLKEELAKLNNNENNSIILRNNILNQNESFIDFYDVIIDIKSIKDIKKGWEIKMNERGKKKYYEYKGMKIIRIDAEKDIEEISPRKFPHNPREDFD